MNYLRLKVGSIKRSQSNTTRYFVKKEADVFDRVEQVTCESGCRLNWVCRLNWPFPKRKWSGAQSAGVASLGSYDTIHGGTYQNPLESLITVSLSAHVHQRRARQHSPSAHQQHAHSCLQQVLPAAGCPECRELAYHRLFRHCYRTLDFPVKRGLSEDHTVTSHYHKKINYFHLFCIALFNEPKTLTVKGGTSLTTTRCVFMYTRLTDISHVSLCLSYSGSTSNVFLLGIS